MSLLCDLCGLKLGEDGSITSFGLSSDNGRRCCTDDHKHHLIPLQQQSVIIPAPITVSSGPAGGGLPRKRGRSFSDEEVSSSLGFIPSARYSTRAISHGGRNPVSKTCFCVDKVTMDNSEHLVWVTALHHGLKKDDSVTIYLNQQYTILDAKCIYDDRLSDIAIILSPCNSTHTKQITPLLLNSRFFVGENVYCAGYGDTFNAGRTSPCVVINCIVAHEEAGEDIKKSLSSSKASAEYHDWRTNRFFLLDKVTDFGFSGAPVLDGMGEVIGMVCSSNNIGVSWALKGDFVKDALKAVNFTTSK